MDGGIKSNFILLHVFIFYLTKNYENKLEKTELKGETEGADLATFLTSIPTYAASNAMYYNPFLPLWTWRIKKKKQNKMKTQLK